MLGKYSMSAAGESFELRVGEPPPERLLPYVRVLVLEEPDLPLLPTNALPATPLGPSNEDRYARGASPAGARH